MSMQSQKNATIPGHKAPARGNPATQKRSRRGWIAGVVVLLVFAGVLISGILERVHSSAALRVETTDMAVPTVSVVTPQRAAPLQEITLPGNVQPYIQSPIFARTNGYLKRWYFDIGAHVKKGQLLAEIETPEVDHQLQQSRGNLGTAEANPRLPHIPKKRY